MAVIAVLAVLTAVLWFPSFVMGWLRTDSVQKIEEIRRRHQKERAVGHWAKLHVGRPVLRSSLPACLPAWLSVV